MPTMGSYCKAYPIVQFREYKNWSERPHQAAPPSEGAEQAPEHNYLFLQENLIVTAGIFLDEEIVFDQVTAEWEDFCRNQLKFEVPDFEREHNEKLAKAKKGEAQ